MKLLHISDLHIGKRVNEFSMLEDQKYILRQILAIADDQQADGVMIAEIFMIGQCPPLMQYRCLIGF